MGRERDAVQQVEREVEALERQMKGIRRGREERKARLRGERGDDMAIERERERVGRE